ncbi:MAG: YbaB/EbfC family nucleoid-associated protein [Clostridia bacterium]|nr:YbaB/EbfC family nucleoid-associated protein [Clostridia bacterium]
MKHGIKIATVVLLVLAIGLSVVGFKGLQIKNEWQTLKDNDYEEYQANIQQYVAKTENCKSIAEVAIANIDGYIAQMKADRAALNKLLYPTDEEETPETEETSETVPAEEAGAVTEETTTAVETPVETAENPEAATETVVADATAPTEGEALAEETAAEAEDGLRTVEAASGGGDVKVVFTDRPEMTDITLAEKVVNPEEVDKLEGFIMTAVNDALRKAEQPVAPEVDPLFKDIDACIEAAEKAREEAVGYLETNEGKNILYRLEQVNAFAGLNPEDAEAVKQANSDLFKQFNLANTYLKKIINYDGQHPKTSEATTRKQYEKAVEQVKKVAEENGLEIELTPYEPETSSVDLFVQQIQQFEEQAKAENAKSSEEKDEAAQRIAERKAQIKELETGTNGTLKDNWDYFFWGAGLLLVIGVLCLIGWLKPDLLKKIGAAANKNMMLVALVVITLFFFIMTHYANLSPQNITNVINQAGYIVILATGMLLCIISSANIDLSVGRVMGFIAACAAILVEDVKLPVAVVLPLCLLIGIAIGAWQGFWIAYMKIPAFVVTLAGQLTFYGLTMVLLKGETRAPFPEGFRNIFGGSLGGDKSLALWIGLIVVAAFVGLKFYGRIKQARKGNAVEPLGKMLLKTGLISAVLIWVFYSLSQDRGMPMVLITVSLVLIAYTFLTQKTVPGRHLYAMGGNVNAARLSGVKTQRMLFLTYVNMGFLASLAGLTYAVRANSAFPMAGQGEELNAIAACYIGGASAYGGIGTVGGAVVGALTMAMIKNGMSMVGMSMDIQQVVLGLVLLVAVVIDIISKNGSSISLFSRFGFGKHKEAAHTETQAEKAAEKQVK